jgi:lysozyme
MKTNRAGIDLIKRWEGCRLTAYPDPATKGEPYTIGYGHTSLAGPPKVARGMKITQVQANEILVADLVKFEAAVSKALTRNPNENQFSAMVSLCFNIGPGNFGKSSVVRRFNAGDAAGAANAFRLWNKAAGKVMKGLVSRRESERELFLRSV